MRAAFDMHHDADIITPLLGQLWRAVLRRRAPLWLVCGLPCLILIRTVPAFVCALLVWLVAVILDGLYWHRRLQRDWPRWLDATLPALEDSSALLAMSDGAAMSPLAQLQRRRLLERLSALMSQDEMRRIVRARVPMPWIWCIPVLMAASLTWWLLQDGRDWQPPVLSRVLASLTQQTLVLTVTPPAYTGMAPFESVARDLDVPEHSQVRWCQQNSSDAALQIELSDGQLLSMKAHCAQWEATESVFWRSRVLQSENSQPGARFTLRVKPDLAPEISITAPAELIEVIASQATSVAISVAVRDDYALVRASLHMTLARGSGENIRFQDREMPLPASADPHVRSMNKRWTLTELGMEPGDELYFFVRATDNAPLHPHTTQSPTYTLRLPGPPAEDLEASALPSLVKPESLRSQRQIIIDTEQLIADIRATPTIGSKFIRERSEAIAADQSQLRLRYGQFLGEESSLFGDEHDADDGHQEKSGKSAQDNLLAQFGHAHDQAENATLFDEATKEVLRRALSAMWEAEKHLRALTPVPALPFEIKALEAIKQLQQAERIYLHRTAFVPPALKEEKRMTGDMAGAASYRRAQGLPPVFVPAELAELVRALNADTLLPALWRAQAQDWITGRLRNDTQRLAAQKSLQDVADGCVPCKSVLAAYLRSTMNEQHIILQASPDVDTPFLQAWRARGTP